MTTADADTTHLEVVEQHEDRKQRSIEARLMRAKLHDRLAVKNERLGEMRESLKRAGRLTRMAAGWQRLDR